MGHAEMVWISRWSQFWITTVVPATKDPLLWDRLVLCDRPLSTPNSIFCTFCSPISDCTPRKDHPVTAEGVVFHRRDNCTDIAMEELLTEWSYLFWASSSLYITAELINGLTECPHISRSLLLSLWGPLTAKHIFWWTVNMTDRIARISTANLNWHKLWIGFVVSDRFYVWEAMTHHGHYWSVLTKFFPQFPSQFLPQLHVLFITPSLV